MKTLREVITEAAAEGRAVAHFNVGNLEMLRAADAASKETGLPVVIGVSEGERDFFGVRNIVALVATLRLENPNVFLNADHTYSVERAKEAIDAGFDSVIFDGAKLSFEENVEKTRECVAYAQSSGKDVLIEGELGYIGSGSQILDVLPEGAAVEENSLTTALEAKRFVDETGVHLFAPAVGNVHGMLRGTGNPHLSISAIEAIRAAVPVPLVLHGGSGVSDADFAAAVRAGIALIHVSTELRVAYRQALVQALADTPDELAPYKYGTAGLRAVEKVAKARLNLFAGRS